MAYGFLDSYMQRFGGRNDLLMPQPGGGFGQQNQGFGQQFGMFRNPWQQPQQGGGPQGERPWGESRPGEMYVQWEGPGNPSWERRNPQYAPGGGQEWNPGGGTNPNTGQPWQQLPDLSGNPPFRNRGLENMPTGGHGQRFGQMPVNKIAPPATAPQQRQNPLPDYLRGMAGSGGFNGFGRTR